MSSSSSLPVRAPFTTHNRRNRQNVTNNKVSSNNDGAEKSMVQKSQPSCHLSKQKTINSNVDIPLDSTNPLSPNDTTDQQQDRSQELVDSNPNRHSEHDQGTSTATRCTRSITEEHVSNTNTSGIFRSRQMDSSNISCWQQLQSANSITEYSDDDDASVENTIQSASRDLPAQQNASTILFWDDCIFSTTDTVSFAGLGERTTQSVIPNGNTNNCILQFR
jgi:hypothetical protein